MSTFIVLIIFPIVFMTILFILFSSSVPGITNEQFLAGCPMPLRQGVATANIDPPGSIRVIYTVDYGTGNNVTGSFFRCYLSGSVRTVSVDPKPYGQTAFNTIPTGWLAYVGDTISAVFERAIHIFSMLWLYNTSPPSQFATVPLWGYINTGALTFIVLGIILIARGVK